MGIFHRRQSVIYSPLDPPRLHAVCMPNVAALTKDPEVIKALVDAAKANMDRLGPDGIEKSYPKLQQLRKELINALATGRVSAIGSIDAALSFPLSAGWMVGEMENKSGVAKAALSEAHYWTAMTVLGSWQNPESELANEEHFSLWAAYYVARKSGESIDEVVAAVKVG